MKVKFEAKFAKDLRAIKDTKTLAKVKEVICECQAAENLFDLVHVKKLQGYTNFYRIRLGDYRIGIEIVNDEIIFTRFLHRKDIYKYFP
jgi:mRNA interferase RelE/StbE